MINIYIDSTFYAGSILAIIFYLLGKYKTEFDRKYYKIFIAIFFFYLIGVSIALYVGTIHENASNLIYDDFRASTILISMLATIGLLSRIKQVDKFKKILTCLAVIFLFCILFVRILETNLLGNLVKITSVQLLNVTFLGFYGLYLITEKKYKKFGQLIAVMAWTVLVISFTKFYFIPIILLPLTWILIVTRNFNRVKQLVGILLIIIIITSSLFFFRDNITSFATSYPTFNAYWHGRVVDGNLLSDGGLRDGSRFMIWNDLLQQFYKSPWLGIGYGARPTFLNVADHNIFIFFLVRFGAPIFITLFILTFGLFVHMLYFVRIGRISRFVLFSLFLTYFLTSAIDPKPYAIITNSLLTAAIAGVILNTKSKTVFLS